MRTKASALEAAVPGDLDEFRGFERELFEELSKGFKKRLDWTTTHGDLPSVDQEDRFIYMGNHPHLTACWPWAAFLSEHFAHNMVAVGKDDFLKNPVYRWILGGLMDRTGKGLFIDQSDRKAALKKIENRAHELLTPGTGMVIFPDRRPFPSRIREQQYKWDKKRPDLGVGQWMTETCFPHSGALWSLTQATRDMDLRIMDVTTIEPMPIHSTGATLHIEVEELTRKDLLGSNESLEHLNGALQELWREKNRKIRKARGLKL